MQSANFAYSVTKNSIWYTCVLVVPHSYELQPHTLRKSPTSRTSIIMYYFTILYVKSELRASKNVWCGMQSANFPNSVSKNIIWYTCGLVVPHSCELQPHTLRKSSISRTSIMMYYFTILYGKSALRAPKNVRYGMQNANFPNSVSKNIIWYYFLYSYVIDMVYDLERRDQWWKVFPSRWTKKKMKELLTGKMWLKREVKFL